MNDDKSYVGMSTCFWCGKPKEILLDRRFRDSLPREACYNKEPCDTCKGYMEQGVILISARDGEQGDNPYRTGGWVVVTKEAFARCFTAGANKGVAFVEDSAWDAIGLPREA
jgi:hypothetical protein